MWSFDSLNKTVNERMSSEAGASPDPAILKNISWNKRRGKNLTRSVQNVKFYAEVTKRNRDTNGLESLKLVQSAIERYLTGKTLHSCPSCSPGSFIAQKNSISELHRLHSQIPSPKTTRRLNLNHRRKEGFPSLIQATRIEFWCMKEAVFVLTSELLVCLLCLNEFSSHDIVLHTK